MTMTLFTAGWTFFRDVDALGRTVRLPHDAMVSEPR